MNINAFNVLMAYRRKVLKEKGLTWFHSGNEGLFGMTSQGQA